MPSAKGTILLIDDSPDFREIFSLKLGEAGFTVETAENGEDGIKKVQSVNPDLILLDMEMPVLNGAETLAKMKTDPNFAGHKVAFLTNLSDSQNEAMINDEKFAKEAGAVAYIKKTDDLDDIVSKVKAICSGR